MIEGRKPTLIKKAEIVKKKKPALRSNVDANRAKGDVNQQIKDTQASIKKKFVPKLPPNARADFAALFSDKKDDGQS